MNYFIIGYYALLIGCSCLAAHYNRREIFLLLFGLTLASFVMGIIGGESALWTVTVCAGHHRTFGRNGLSRSGSSW